MQNSVSMEMGTFLLLMLFCQQGSGRWQSRTGESNRPEGYPTPCVVMFNNKMGKLARDDAAPAWVLDGDRLLMSNCTSDVLLCVVVVFKIIFIFFLFNNSYFSVNFLTLRALSTILILLQRSKWSAMWNHNIEKMWPQKMKHSA